MVKDHESEEKTGYGIVKIGDHSFKAGWGFYGVRPILEWRTMDGGVHSRKGILEYAKYSILLDEELPEGIEMPKVNTATSLMVDENMVGSGNVWWVIQYSNHEGKLFVELCNRPSG